MCFVTSADKAGEPSIGTAAMIAFYWLQREEDILTRLSGPHYRPVDVPDYVRIFHHKTREQVDLPLFDEDGTNLWPEMMERPRRHRTARHAHRHARRSRPARKICLPWKKDYFQHRVADIRAAAGINPKAKFMSLRHDGNTEGADANLSDAQLRAPSGHRSANMPMIYARATHEAASRRGAQASRRENETREFVGMSRRWIVGTRIRRVA